MTLGVTEIRTKVVVIVRNEHDELTKQAIELCPVRQLPLDQQAL